MCIRDSASSGRKSSTQISRTFFWSAASALAKHKLVARKSARREHTFQFLKHVLQRCNILKIQVRLGAKALTSLPEFFQCRLSLGKSSVLSQSSNLAANLVAEVVKTFDELWDSKLLTSSATKLSAAFYKPFWR